MSAENFDLLDIDADTVCRMCLSQPSQLQNLFSSTIVDGYIIRIPEMVKFCLDIIVSAGQIFSFYNIIILMIQMHKIQNLGRTIG